eukprot:1788835-Rhodomonas_salina.5
MLLGHVRPRIAYAEYSDSVFCYAVPGTSRTLRSPTAHAQYQHSVCCADDHPIRTPIASAAIGLRACSVLTSCYLSTQYWPTLCCYAPATPCPVLTSAMLLSGPTRCTALPSRALAPRPLARRGTLLAPMPHAMPSAHIASLACYAISDIGTASTYGYLASIYGCLASIYGRIAANYGCGASYHGCRHSAAVFGADAARVAAGRCLPSTVTQCFCLWMLYFCLRMQYFGILMQCFSLRSENGRAAAYADRATQCALTRTAVCTELAAHYKAQVQRPAPPMHTPYAHALCTRPMPCVVLAAGVVLRRVQC